VLGCPFLFGFGHVESIDRAIAERPRFPLNERVPFPGALSNIVSAGDLFARKDAPRCDVLGAVVRGEVSHTAEPTPLVS